MSKNVAVFVDVANIFYAAKAAGIDIDYVTLLKSATANRDFVRAYAYTGLDPENENQRQFHAFLSRSGYKVVSKDIRKYGDGRIKANLDIELVVDMMRMAEKLDVAVVVSGDGDFAPAIAAVQQQGVRVEVISFRGNTSSDLIDVADVFIDIANLAKVEKGARSGRRVASEGDLSMTAVPEKESGVTPRRRRRRGESDERPERGMRVSRQRRGTQEITEEAPPEAAGTAGLVAMPGEKLSRGAGAAEPAEVADAADEGAVPDALDREGDGEEAGGRRRRRRRGGRGRGRGGRGAEPGETIEEAPEAEAAVHPDEVPTLPQHSGFGSVWDSQIGAPAGHSTPTSSDDADDYDEDFDGDPEVPEYLLAEKKGRRRGGRGRSGHSGGYRAALDRERYGMGGRSSYASGARGRGGRHSGAPRASAQAMEPIEQTPGGDPWSEVPPEVQELLRAELARRSSAPDLGTADVPEAEPAKPARKRSTRESGGDADGSGAVSQPQADADAKPAKTTRRRTTKKAAEAEADADAKPAKTTRRRTTKKAAEAEADADARPAKTTRRRTTKKAAEEKPEAAAEGDVGEA